VLKGHDVIRAGMQLTKLQFQPLRENELMKFRSRKDLSPIFYDICNTTEVAPATRQSGIRFFRFLFRI
jgi:hypothetical protein